MNKWSNRKVLKLFQPNLVETMFDNQELTYLILVTLGLFSILCELVVK